MISKTIHSQAYEVFTWAEIGIHTFTLAKKIIDSKEKFDRVVALARGGVSIAQSLSDLIGVKQISVVQSEMYTGIETRAKAPIIVQPLAANIKGEQVLLIDDLVDTGETLLFAKQYLCAHGPDSVKTATLASKPWTKITPDFYELESDAWMIFPWEVRETIQTLASMWEKKGDSSKKINTQLSSLGYSDLEIATFT